MNRTGVHDYGAGDVNVDLQLLDSKNYKPYPKERTRKVPSARDPNARPILYGGRSSVFLVMATGICFKPKLTGNQEAAIKIAGFRIPHIRARDH